MVERGEIDWTGIDVEPVFELESGALWGLCIWLLDGLAVSHSRQLLDYLLPLILGESADCVEDLADTVHASQGSAYQAPRQPNGTTGSRQAAWLSGSPQNPELQAAGRGPRRGVVGGAASRHKGGT